jgi:hypothetical protein
LNAEVVDEAVALDYGEVGALEGDGAAFEAVAPGGQAYQLNVLVDLPIDADTHGEREAVDQHDDNCDCDVGGEVVVCGLATGYILVGGGGGAGGAGVWVGVDGAGGALGGAEGVDAVNQNS